MTNRYKPYIFTLGTMILLFLAGNFLGCEPEDWIINPDCNDCFSLKPDSAKLIVYLSINAENDSIPLTFTRGDSQGEMDWQDTATMSEFYLDAAVGSVYTVKAEYSVASKTVLAFDADIMTLKDYGDECGSPCYIIKGGIFDLRLISD